MTLINAILILAALAIGWILLKVFLRLTIRLFACGCVAIAGFVGIVWLIFQLV